MSPSKKVLHPVVLLSALFILGGCERDTYTTWNCRSASETKITMVLRKAKMEFQGAKFDFCGSLGNQSYFDQKCPAQTSQSGTVFTPSSGELVMNGQEYQCAAL